MGPVPFRAAAAALAADALAADAPPLLPAHRHPEQMEQMEQQLADAVRQGDLQLVQDLLVAMGGAGAPAVLRALSQPHPNWGPDSMLFHTCISGIGGISMVTALAAAYGPVGCPAVLAALHSGPPTHCLIVRIVRNAEASVVECLLRACGAPGSPQVLQVLEAGVHELIREASIYGHDDTLSILAMAYGAQVGSSLLPHLQLDAELGGNVRNTLRASVPFANFLLPLEEAWSSGGAALVRDVTSRERRIELAMPILLVVHQLPPIIKCLMINFFRRRPWVMFG